MLIERLKLMIKQLKQPKFIENDKIIENDDKNVKIKQFLKDF